MFEEYTKDIPRITEDEFCPKLKNIHLETKQHDSYKKKRVLLHTKFCKESKLFPRETFCSV